MGRGMLIMSVAGRRSRFAVDSRRGPVRKQVSRSCGGSGRGGTGLDNETRMKSLKKVRSIGGIR